MAHVKKIVLLIFLLNFLSLNSFADILIAPGLSIQQGTSNSGATSLNPTSYATTSNLQVLEFVIAWTTEKSWAFGINSATDTQSIKIGSSAASTYTRASTGLVAGMVTEKFSGLFTYYFASSYSLASASSTYTGSGFQLDLGYKIPVKGWAFGPRLTYRSFSYTNYTYSSTSESLSTAKTDVELYPSVGVWLTF